MKKLYAILLLLLISCSLSFAQTKTVSHKKATDTATDYDVPTLKYYPNPVKDLFYVSFEKEITTLTVINFLGQTVIEKSIHSTQGNVDMSALAPGVYFIKITAVGLSKTLKVIKE
ncbi:T9SS type A sorting domain-containing protein [Flavobacterium poyangense]|uniref:T9SS type A sorting domain-containing protein n=1 Tax=Flavobacterium poyangense TaxID=2204302 RepID=UPI00141DFE63|nr:T9SS type A sorting domain-containing protein [Flavobacterium sp. JXAS1]